MKLEIIKMSFESLLANKTRSLLSMLGIIIGVTTVIAVFAIGQGARQAVDDQFQNLSANSILVMSNRGRGSTGSSKLKAGDAAAILEKADYISMAAGAINGNAAVSYGSESSSFTIVGSDANYFGISNLKIASGRVYTEEEIKNRDKVAVLGYGTLETLFPDGEEPLGVSLTIAGKKIEVIGVLEEVGTSMGMMRADDSIFIPSLTAETSILGTRGTVFINTQANSAENVEAATNEITAILREEHKLKVGQEDDFRIMDAGSMVGTAQNAAKLMTLILTAIAAITLLVSGIGIMNVMFVTVAERTKEIGIAKAIGGKRADILGQFLLESVVLSMIGGIIGISLGQGIIYLVNRIEALQAIITLAPSILGVSIGFGFSVLVGVTFGFYPALKASRLDPVDALRSE